MNDKKQWQRTAINLSHGFQTREDGENIYIEGYFAVFDGFYNLWCGDQERIDRHAFDETIGDDVRALINHDTTLVLGRTTAGTLTLRLDDHGLFGTILINRADQDAMNLYARVQRGDVSQCSFGFDVLDQDYENRADGTVLWTIRKVKLYEITCCTFAAYEDTEISARRAEHDELKRKALQSWKIRTHEKLKHTERGENDGTQSTNPAAED